MEVLEPKKQEIFDILQHLKNGAEDASVQRLEQLFNELFSDGRQDVRGESVLDELNAAINETAMLAYTNSLGQIQEVNENFLRKTGYTADELRGKSMEIFDGGQHSPEFFMDLWGTISSGKIWKGEVAKKTRHGEILWLKTSIVPILDQAGNIQRFISLYIDISSRKRIQEELALFLSLLNFSTDAIQVANVRGRFIYVNEKAIENLGYSKEELLEMNVWEVENVFTGPGDWVEHIEEVRKHPGGYLVEGQHQRKNGLLFPVEVNVRYFEQGNEAYLIAVVRDVTERKLNASAIEKAKRQLGEAQQMARVCSYETDVLTNITTWSPNAETVFGISGPQEFLMEYLMQHMHASDREKALEKFAESGLHGEKFEMEYRLLVPGQEIQYIHFINHPQKDPDGKVNRFVGTSQNITDSVKVRNRLKDYNDELEKRNNELDRFAQIVSHDLKAPLRAIHNISDWIREENPGLGEETDKKINLLQKRVERMEYLIKGILNYSGAGRVKESPAKFSSAQSIKGITDSYADHGEVNFLLGYLPDITAHRLVFEQVIGNLVNNAIRHNLKPDKQVHIYAEASDNEGTVCFVVQDNGPGIREDYHEKIFLIFQTLLPRDKLENTGVGLAIVKKLCEERNWKISLSSSSGNGCCFRLVIPVHN